MIEVGSRSAGPIGQAGCEGKWRNLGSRHGRPYGPVSIFPRCPLYVGTGIWANAHSGVITMAGGPGFPTVHSLVRVAAACSPAPPLLNRAGRGDAVGRGEGPA